MSAGFILLIVMGILIFFAVGQRVLDHLRLSDRQAMLGIALMMIGGLLPDIPLGGSVYLNVGGALIPFALTVYLIARAGSGWERARCLIASLATAAATLALSRFLPSEPEQLAFDPNYLYGLAGGVIAYLFGRSRRGAFVAGTLGVLIADILENLLLRGQGTEQALRLGGAGALDIAVISGFAALLLAELIGEITERVVRGNRAALRKGGAQ